MDSLKYFLIYIKKCIYLEYVISLRVEYHYALIEMMVLHCAGSVQNSQWRFCFGLECIVGATMV